jgi:NADPH:quinone reductase-like Zn-dependent oxidoreductase
MGVDVVGTVEEIGKEVQDFKIGDEVCGILAADRTGAFAEYVCVPQYQLASSSLDINHQIVNNYWFLNPTVLRPSLVSEEDAAAVLTPGLRAYTALQYKMKTMAGDTILVMNGASVRISSFASTFLESIFSDEAFRQMDTFWYS